MYTDTMPINLSVRWPLPATLKVGPTRLLCFILLVYAHQAIRLHVSQPKPQTQLQKPSLPAVQRKLCDAFPHIATTNARLVGALNVLRQTTSWVATPP